MNEVTHWLEIDPASEFIPLCGAEKAHWIRGVYMTQELVTCPNCLNRLLEKAICQIASDDKGKGKRR